MEKIITNHHRVTFILSVILFRIILESSYIYAIPNSLLFTSYNFSPSLDNYLISWAIFFLLIPFISDWFTKASDYFFIIFLLIVITPMLIIYGYDAVLNNSISNSISLSIFSLAETVNLKSIIGIIISFLSIQLIIRLKMPLFKNLPVLKHGFYIAIIVSSLFVVFLIFWYYISGVYFNLDLSKVYDLRVFNSNLSSKGIFAYTNGWTYNIFNMFLLSVALLKRKTILVILIICVQIYFFAGSAHKAVLFMPILILFLYFFSNRTPSLIIIPISLILICTMTMVLFTFFDQRFLLGIFLRRLFFIPADLTFAYFDFFSTNLHVYWSNSVLKSFISYPYDSLSVSFKIGSYIGQPKMYANSGFVSSGYAHAGYLGIILYSFILGILVKLVDYMSKDSVPPWFAVSIIITPFIFVLTSADLLVVGLTHGMFISLILIFLSRGVGLAQK